MNTTESSTQESHIQRFNLNLSSNKGECLLQTKVDVNSVKYLHRKREGTWNVWSKGQGEMATSSFSANDVLTNEINMSGRLWTGKLSISFCIMCKDKSSQSHTRMTYEATWMQVLPIYPHHKGSSVLVGLIIAKATPKNSGDWTNLPAHVPWARPNFFNFGMRMHTRDGHPHVIKIFSSIVFCVSAVRFLVYWRRESSSCLFRLHSVWRSARQYCVCHAVWYMATQLQLLLHIKIN